MASFQVHVDQENKVTRQTRNLRSNKGFTSNTLGGSRSVLGVINNNSRLSSRPTKNDGSKKDIPKTTTLFSVYQDDRDNENCKKASSAAVSGLSPKENASCSTKNEIIPTSDEKLDLSSKIITDVYQHRKPLKDLKMIDEEEPMLEGSFIETSEPSPMVVDRSLSLTITPTSPQTIPEVILKETAPAIYDVAEYREEIFTYLREAETRHRPKPYYMKRQPDVTYSMRSVLVDWLVEVTEEYKLQTETLYLAISFIDRFLSVMSVVRGKLQLLGTAAMFIASKYEEIYPPEVHEFVYITDDTYKKKQVLRMEHLILKVLTFDISTPTILAFLNHISAQCKLPEKVLHLAMYLCELSLLEGDPYLQYLPSMIACSAIALAHNCLEYKDVWSSELSNATGYDLEDLAECVGNLNETHTRAKSLDQQAIYEKYKINKWHNASEVQHRKLVVSCNDQTKS